MASLQRGGRGCCRRTEAGRSMWFHIGDARSLKEPQKKLLDFSFLGGGTKKSCLRGRSTRYVATKLVQVGNTRRRCRSRLYFCFHAGGREAAANHSVSTHWSPAPPPLHPHPQLPSHPSSGPFDFQGAGARWVTTARGHNLKRH